MKAVFCAGLSGLATASAFVAPGVGMRARQMIMQSAEVEAVPDVTAVPDVEVAAVPAVEIPAAPAVLSGPEYLATLPGAAAPLGIFDPLGLAGKVDANSVKKWREAEIKHGRVSMLAVLGLIVQEIAHPLYRGGEDLGPATFHMQAVEQDFPLAPVSLLLLVGVFEANNIYMGWKMQSIKEGVAPLKDGFEPGNFGFDPLGLLPKDEAGAMAMKTKELNNGRLAMIAVLGVWLQEIAEHQTIFQHFGF